MLCENAPQKQFRTCDRIMTFSRRTLLLAGLAAAATTRLTTDHLRNQTVQAKQTALEDLARHQVDTEAMLDQAFSGEGAALDEIREIRTTIQLARPTEPYHRHISKRLIHCNKLTTEQYVKGKIEPDYNGSIRELPSYDKTLSTYTQIGTLIGEETDITEHVEVTLPSEDELNTLPSALSHQVRQAETTLTDTVREMVKLRRTVPVYFGFVLASEQHSLILLRGTQRRREWLTNLSVIQNPYRLYQDDRVLESTLDYGLVHVGFASAYRESFHSSLIALARQLNPALPCYVSGHSLGGALASMAVLDLALHLPELRSQLQLYTYASPRVGNPAFANLHSQLIPNSYRITNVADMVPLVPPTKLGADYAHVGQSWSFLSQNGDVLPNHLIEVYRHAIHQELETQDDIEYRNLSII